MAPIIRALVWVLTPLAAAAQSLVSGVLRMFGVSVAASLGHDEREEELRGLIEMHADGGEEVAHERAMLRSILDLADVEVSEIMTHRRNVRMLDADAPLSDLLEHVLDSPFTRLPLYKGESDNIVGVLHVKALLRAIRAQLSQPTGEYSADRWKPVVEGSAAAAVARHSPASSIAVLWCSAMAPSQPSQP